MIVKDEIPSTYTKKFGEILYNKVLEYKPKTICDIGVYYGFSTVHLATAAKEIGSKVTVIDLFEEYQYNHCTLEKFKETIDDHGLDDVVEIVQMDYRQWLSTQRVRFDMIHFDVSNTGDSIMHLLNRVLGDPKILFEGGSVTRDNVDWMCKYNKPKIIDTLKGNDYNFKVLYEEQYEREGRIFNPCLSELC